MTTIFFTMWLVYNHKDAPPPPPIPFEDALLGYMLFAWAIMGLLCLMFRDLETL